MTDAAVQRLRPPRRFGAWVTWILGVLLLLGLAWTGFWIFAEHEAASSLDAWIAREKIFKRNWRCPDRRIAGFPSAITISCSKPQFDGLIFGRHYAGSLAGFVATAEFSHPSDVTVNAAPPFAATADDKSEDITLSWDQLSILLGGVPQNVTAISLTGQALSLHGQAKGFGALSGAAVHISASFAQPVDRQDRAIAFHIVLNGASSPLIDRFFGSAAAAEVTADGTITQASFDPAKTLAQTLDQWRAVGGEINFANLTVTHGETRLQAHGALSIDTAHELQGELDTKCVGFEQVLLKLGVDPALVTVGSLLTNLLSGNSAKSGPQPLHLPVGFSSGRLSIGPVQTSIRLPPIY
jgi:hypothetical protein